MKDSSDGIDLVGQIAGFTSLRDVDLLELSLLKSVFTIVNPIQVSLVTLDSQNIIIKKVDYSADKHGTISSKIDASEEILSACEQLDNSNLEYCTVSTKEASLTLFLLSHTRKIAHYVTIESRTFGVSKSHLQQIMGMLKIYRNFKLLLQESQTDELTGLSNRKAFDGIVRKIHEASIPSSEPIANDKRSKELEGRYWLAMVDIDHFKNVNDTHGHLMGDEVLVRVTQSMQSVTRDSDYLFRYGGEEFAVILCVQDKADAINLMERMRLAVEGMVLPQIGNVTISTGVVEMLKDIFYISLIERADKALYKSKSNGRNQVTFYEEEQSKSGDSFAESEFELF